MQGERNFIMQVVCEATQSDCVEIQVAAYGILVRLMQLYYDKMAVYVQKALYGVRLRNTHHGTPYSILNSSL
jgi:importin subunit beta-1